MENTVTYDGHDYIITGNLKEDKVVSVAEASSDEDLGTIFIESYSSEYYVVQNAEADEVCSHHANNFASLNDVYLWAIVALTQG